MARKHLSVPVATTGPLSIRTGQYGIGEDSELRVSAEGHPVLPGSAVAGALRAAAHRRYGRDRTATLFGEVVTGDAAAELTSAGQLTGTPSRIAVFDAVAPTVTDGQLRHRVGVDRATQSAKPGLLFDTRVWPQGLAFELRFECDETDLPELLGAISELLSPAGGIGAGACGLERTGTPRVGSAVRFGHTAIGDARARWSEPAAGRWPATPQDCEVAAREPTADAGWLQLEVWFRLLSPLAARVPIDVTTASAHDNLPFTIEQISAEGLQRAVGYPGTSLKGRLRQRAEYLFASVGQPAPDPWATDSGGVHPVQVTFGHASGGREADTSDGAAGRVRCSDLLAGEADPRDRGPRPLWSPNPPEAHPLVIVRDRVAVDRLAGSTYASAKFDDTVVRDGVWLTGTITIVPHLDEHLEDADLALVAAGLRDLATRRIGLGGSSYSGYGDVELVGGHVRERRGSEVTSAALAPSSEDPVGLPAELAQRARHAWQRVSQGAAA